jgi:protoporphyrin/coproporphyrin ferrochelatase
VWMEEGAPLRVISERQAMRLQERLAIDHHGRVRVALGMRYGNPSLGAGLRELREAGAKRIVVLPLYPQYSCSTTASTLDALAAALKPGRDLPAIRFVHDYHDDAGYIDALALSIKEAWRGDGPAERLLFSFHGTPARYREEGDPYYQQCLCTAEQVAGRLALPAERWQVVFQSRFGREPWLQPYMDATLKTLPGDGVRNVDVICPGFAADCLETLEEIAVANRELFLKSGGESYRYITALNDRPEHIQALADIVGRELCGWV